MTELDLRSEYAKEQTGLVARCQVCGFEWQIQSFDRSDAKGCSFCDAPESAITVISEESNDYSANKY